MVIKDEHEKKWITILSESPHQGYTKASLTIGAAIPSQDQTTYGILGFYNSYSEDFKTNCYTGTLSPSLGLSKLSLTNLAWFLYVECEREFYYNNVLYKPNEYSASDTSTYDKLVALHDDWISRIGQTVTVYIRNA